MLSIVRSVRLCVWKSECIAVLPTSVVVFYLEFLYLSAVADQIIFQDGGDPDETVLQRESSGEDWLPEGRRC